MFPPTQHCSPTPRPSFAGNFYYLAFFCLKKNKTFCFSWVFIFLGIYLLALLSFTLKKNESMLLHLCFCLLGAGVTECSNKWASESKSSCGQLIHLPVLCSKVQNLLSVKNSHGGAQSRTG